MQNIKINKFYLVLMALCITFYAQPMDRPEPRDMFMVGWVGVVGAILLGASTLKDLWQTQKSEIAKISRPQADTSHFYILPPEIEKLIILYTSADSLKEAAFTVNSLALVDKYLNQTINDPRFCLEQIKYLAKRFNCSHMDVCKALQTKAANERLLLQKKLYDLCKGNTDTNLIQQTFEQIQNLAGYQKSFSSQFNDLYKESSVITPDLEFTYTEEMENYIAPYKKTILYLTPLMLASIHNDKIGLVPILLDKKVNINSIEASDMTPLMFAVVTRNILVVELLCKDADIQIDKQNSNGNTALLFSLLPTSYTPMSDKITFAKITELILQAGADPELKNNQGLTPLQAADNARKIQGNRGGQAAYELIIKAIKKKDEQKK